MTVDDEPEMVQGFTGDLDTLREVILKQRAGGGTALYDAIYQACQQLLKLPPLVGDPDKDMRPVLVVISDGDDNLSRHSRGEALEIAHTRRHRHLHHQHQHQLDPYRSGSWPRRSFQSEIHEGRGR